MHGTTIKVIDAQQAKLTNIYKNTKFKLLKTNAALWYNKICKEKQLQPRYISIRTGGQRQQDKKTTTHAIRFRIKVHLLVIINKFIQNARYNNQSYCYR